LKENQNEGNCAYIHHSIPASLQRRRLNFESSELLGWDDIRRLVVRRCFSILETPIGQKSCGFSDSITVTCWISTVC
jgi:hypothetical protein